MANDPDDADFRRLFTELREVESRRAAPPFEPAWARAAARAATRRPYPVRALVAMNTLAAAAVLTVFLLGRPHRPAVVDIAAWQSPTAFLLHGPGDALLRDLPRLESSLLTHLTIPNLPRGTP